MKSLVLSAGVAVALGVAACGPSAFLLNDGIPGPHGESLTKLGCVQIEDCYRLAREQCRGNFDIAAQDVRPEDTSRPNTLLYSCSASPAATATTTTGAK